MTPFVYVHLFIVLFDSVELYESVLTAIVFLTDKEHQASNGASDATRMHQILQ